MRPRGGLTLPRDGELRGPKGGSGCLTLPPSLAARWGSWMRSRDPFDARRRDRRMDRRRRRGAGPPRAGTGYRLCRSRSLRDYGRCFCIHAHREQLRKYRTLFTVETWPHPQRHEGRASTNRGQAAVAVPLAAAAHNAVGALPACQATAAHRPRHHGRTR